MLKRNLKVWLIAIGVSLIWYFGIFEDGVRFHLLIQGFEEIFDNIIKDSAQDITDNAKSAFGF